LRQPFQLARTEYPPCAASLFQAYDTKRVYLVRDPIEARLVQPNAAYCEAGGGDGTDRRYRVIEAVLVDTEHGGYSIDPVPAGGAERNAIDDPR
jgi:hypothetical protein